MKYVRLIFLNYMVLISILGTVEILGHFTYRVVKGKYLFEKKRQTNTLFQEHPYLVGIPKKNFQLEDLPEGFEISTDQDGYRVTKNYTPKSEALNVICIGGSTTFGTGVSDEFSWPYQLQSKLGEKFNVINMGVPGYSTVEAIIQLATIVPEMEPDILIFYQGWNDIRNYHVEEKYPEYRWHGMSQKTNLSVERKESLLDYSFIYNLSTKIRNKVLGSSDISRNSFESNDVYVDHIYERNLRTLQLLSTQLGVKQVYVPQVLNLESYDQSNEEIDLWTPKIKNKSMPELMKGFNDIMSDSIEEDSLSIVMDSIMTKYQWDDSHFVDKGHFSKIGGEKFCTIIIEHLEVLIDSKSKQ